MLSVLIMQRVLLSVTPELDQTYLYNTTCIMTLKNDVPHEGRNVLWDCSWLNGYVHVEGKVKPCMLVLILLEYDFSIQ